MSDAVELGRFGHHPDPAIDFCVEVEEIEAIWTDRCLKVANPDDGGLEARVGAAMAFRVGGDLHAINAKDRIRAIVTLLDEELFARHDRMRATAPDLYECLAEAESLFSSRGLLANDPACGPWIKATREALSRADPQEEET